MKTLVLVEHDGKAIKDATLATVIGCTKLRKPDASLVRPTAP